MKRTGGWRAAVLGATGVLAGAFALAAVTATPALAHGAPGDGYQGDVKGVQVEAKRSYDQPTNRTTFTFTLKLNQGEEKVSHVLLMACPDIDIVSATGPDGPDGTPKPASTTPQEDGSIKDSPHVGIKFDPGYRGVYTITFAGNISGAEFVVKDGTGHQHFTAGSDACKTVTPEAPNTPNPPANNPPTDNPPTNNPPAENPPTNNPPTNNPPTNNPPTNNPPATPAANQPSQPGTEVQGATLTNTSPGSEVLGAQQSAPAPRTDATLPRTGSDLAPLLPIGILLAAVGRMVSVASRRG